VKIRGKTRENWAKYGQISQTCFHPVLSSACRTHADVLTSQLAATLGWDSASYEAAKSEADRISPRTHRAEADARHLAVLWRMISKGNAAWRLNI
jgi:hypothetical protein